MIELVGKDKCSGCSACYNACKIGALAMETDESGFWFPKIDRVKCIECGACMRACPAMDKPDCKSNEPKAYIVQNKDDEIRRQSTSGGAFTSIAEKIIDQGGVVFGAAIDEDYKVSHIWVDNKKELSKFRSSKYVQSWIGTVYREAEKFLKAGCEVCFSGTPCQIYGLKKYLGKEYENLITVDVMCRAVPSPKVLQKYLDYQRERYPKFDRIVFRDKSRGYSYSGVALFEGEKAVYRGGSESDPWLRLFLGGYCNRETCHECLYQTGVRASDITLWDCWGTQNYMPEWDDNKGTTNVITWSQQGNSLLTQCKKELRIKEIGIDNIDTSLEKGKLYKPLQDSQKFYSDAEKLDAKEFINKYVPLTSNIFFRSFMRGLLYRLHLHNTVRKVAHKFRKIKRNLKQ